MSSPVFGGTEASDLVQKLEKQGVTVLYSPKAYDKFGYLEKKDPMGDPDDFSNYKLKHFIQAYKDIKKATGSSFY